MAVVGLLCDSFLCRLCAEENKNGTCLFSDENEPNLSNLVNTYLPLKVEDDGQFPRKICPGCTIQLEATKQFFDLLINGQTRLRDLLQTQRDTLNREEKQRKQLEAALKSVNPTSSVETYTIQTDETGEKFLIQIFSEGPLFGPEHELSLKAEGLEKPRRKRGRPPKQDRKEAEAETVQEKSLTEVQPEETAVEEPIEPEPEGDGRKRRRRKLPTRFLEAVQGKELDDIFQEEELDEDDASAEQDNAESDAKPCVEEVIGHLESQDGKNLKELVIVTKKKSRLKRRFHCFYCQASFLHRARLQTHVKLQHGHISTEKSKTKTEEQQSVIKNSTPPQESTNDPNENTTAENTSTQKPDSPDPSVYHCAQCNKDFMCKQNYEVHTRAVHEGVRPFVCRLCLRCFSYANSLRLHMSRHKRDSNSRQYQCGACSKSFRHPSSLLYHRDAEHGDGRKYVCGKCGKSFKHRQLLQRHQLVHSDERPHHCSHCNAAFKTRANLFNHSLTHSSEGMRKYRCAHSQCERTFAHRTSLILHERTHLGIKPYRCDLCTKAFSQKGNLREHRRIHTGEKPYQCDECGRAFTTSSQFRLHCKRHTGERPYRCDHCHKAFLHRDTWKCHVRRHLDDKPFKCSQCERSFAEAWALKKHERLHTGEKPYQCEECSRAFADSSNLAKHRRIHRKPAVEVKMLQELVDESGQPISLSTIEGQQIRVVSSGQQVHGLMPDGTLVPIDLTVQEAVTPLDEKSINEGKADDNGVDVAQLLNGGIQNIQLLAQEMAPQEAEGMCLLTAYDVGTVDGLEQRFLPITLQDTTAATNI